MSILIDILCEADMYTIVEKLLILHPEMVHHPEVLEHAVRSGNSKVVKLLIQNGAERIGESLIIATEDFKTDICLMILDAGVQKSRW